MAKGRGKNQSKKNNKNDKDDESSVFSSVIGIDVRNGIYAIVSLIIALMFILSAFDAAGPGGEFIYRIFSLLVGIGYFLLPILAILLSASYLKSDRPKIPMTKFIGSILFLGSGLALVDISTITNKGGIVGQASAWPFVTLFGNYASIIILGGILIISLLVIFNEKPDWGNMFANLIATFKRNKNKETEINDPYENNEPVEEIPDVQPEPIDAPEESPQEEVASENIEEDEGLLEERPKKRKRNGSYLFPPLSLLAGDRGKPNTGDIKANSNIIKRTLQNFGIEVEMDEITVGPTVTRYALKPAEGVKLSRIVGLQSDLALALAAHPIRVEAPIPGKSLVGIEVPNKAKSIVGLASLLGDEKFQNSAKRLTVALGRNISGASIFGNLSKMPHVLIAGATGSGKSVTIHSIVTSLLYRNSPEDLRLIFIDPKRVELTLYNKIPHLLTPVITNPKKAILALKWAAKEMDRRYDILEQAQVRDIDSYNQTIAGNGEHQPEKFTYIVIIIDELADIMQTYPRELESGIVRLAQMSRAVGIHLVLSTQRPSVNVVTGLIKANIPARVALQVASQIDSRTILDQPGAEKLLGAGDMLYMSGEMSSPERLQSAFISEDEVKKVVQFLKDQAKDDLEDEINLTGENIGVDKSIFEASIDNDEGLDDDMYEEARVTVIETGKASTSFLQRKLGVGYARAAKLIDMLEERGIVGPGNGAKPRDVLEKPVSVESQEFN
jgi:DNA segregation ATPase FtsK/SpoIIIE, S-DNA-T family